MTKTPSRIGSHLTHADIKPAPRKGIDGPAAAVDLGNIEEATPEEKRETGILAAGYISDKPGLSRCLQALGIIDSPSPDQEVRRHIASLHDAGMSLRGIAREARVDNKTLFSIRDGESRGTPETRAKILAVSHAA